MIDVAFSFLKNQLKSYLKLKKNAEQKVHISNLTDNAGKTIAKELTLTLVNIDEERLLRNRNLYQETEEGSFAKVNPEINLNLFCLITSNFGDKETDYEESLKFLSLAATFFQSRFVFNHKTSPDLDDGIKQLIVELQSLSFEQQNNLWSAIGISYLPSLLYKIKMVTLRESETLMEAPPITEVNLTEQA
jgi:hypothetical protein